MNMALDFTSLKYGSPEKPSRNVKMNYMYRDAGNFKLREVAVFSDRHQLTLCQISDFVLAAFIDRVWFDPDLCGIERLVFEEYDSDLDHKWHEIEAISWTDGPVTMEVDLADFLFNAMKSHVKWVQFNCNEDAFEFDP